MAGACVCVFKKSCRVMGNRVYPSASRLRLYTHVTRRLAGAPVRGAGRCATPATCGAHDSHVSRPHERVRHRERGHAALFRYWPMRNGATWHPHEHLRRRTAQHATGAHRIRVQSWTLSAWRSAPGVRQACGTILGERCTQPSREQPQLHWQTASLTVSPQSRLAKA